MVSTQLKSQTGNLPQVEVKIKNVWNHHLIYVFYWEFASLPHPRSPSFIPSSNSDLPSAAAKRVMKGSEASCERSFFHQCHAGWWISPWQKQTLAQLIATYNNTSKLVFGENCIDTSYTKKHSKLGTFQKSGGIFFKMPKNISPQSFSSQNESPSIQLKPEGPTATPHHPSAPNKSGFRRSWVPWAIHCSHCATATSQPRCHQHREGVTKQLRKAW